MSETIDYKALYELVNMENAKLLEKNIELNEELDRYKMSFYAKCSYGEAIMRNIEEAEIIKKREKENKKQNRKKN